MTLALSGRAGALPNHGFSHAGTDHGGNQNIKLVGSAEWMFPVGLRQPIRCPHSCKKTVQNLGHPSRPLTVSYHARSKRISQNPASAILSQGRSAR